jgi:hypothetical protein
VTYSCVCVCVTFSAITGCAPSGDATGAGSGGSPADRSAATAPLSPMPGPVEAEHDFGSVLARGQELRHEFLLRNPTASPIRLLGAEAHTPCCSAIGPLPELLPAGTSVAVPVVFRPGTQTIRKRVTFAVRTDHPDRPVWPLAVAASLTAEVELRPTADSETSLPIGRTGRQRFRVVCRRIGDEGRGGPRAVEADPPLAATLGPAQPSTPPAARPRRLASWTSPCRPRPRTARAGARSACAGRTARRAPGSSNGRSRRGSSRPRPGWSSARGRDESHRRSSFTRPITPSAS